MPDLPITFSGAMVRALLREIERPGAGKTQTRRALKSVGQCAGQPMYPHYINGKRSGASSHPEFVNLSAENGGTPLYGGNTTICPGDRLYVREHWRSWRWNDHLNPGAMPQSWGCSPSTYVGYLADNSNSDMDGRFRQAMHMPKWASRITLLVTDVRVERLQDCSATDAEAEGWPHIGTGGEGAPLAEAYPIGWYANLWDSLNGAGAWDANPWVAVYEFRPVLGNVDQIGEAS